MEVQLHAFLTWEMYGGEGSASRSSRVTSGEITPGTGDRFGLEAVAVIKIPSPCWESKPGRPTRNSSPACVSVCVCVCVCVRCNLLILLLETVDRWQHIYLSLPF